MRDHLLAHSRDGGLTYKGHYGMFRPEEVWIAEIARYTALDGSVVLFPAFRRANRKECRGRKKQTEPITGALTGARQMPTKDEERWKQLAALGAKREIPTPEGEARMSAVILQLAEPIIKKHGRTEERAKAIIMLTIAGWNKSMFPPEKQPLVEKELIDAFVPKDGSAQAVGVSVSIMDLIAARREKFFPDLHKIIVDYEVNISGGRLTLNVTSAPIPDLGGTKSGT